MKTAFILSLATCGVAALSWACGGDDDAPATSTPGGSSSSATTAPASTSGAGSASATSTSKPSTQAKLPADACALLTLYEVRKLGPTAGDGKKTNDPGLGGQPAASCRWEWSEGTSSLDVKVSTLPPGMTAAQLKASLQADVKKTTANGRELSGIGDFAALTSYISADVEIQVLVNGLWLDINLNGLGARDKQELVIALAKAAAGRV